MFFCRASCLPKRRTDPICTAFELKQFFLYHLEEAAFFKGHVKYYWINYGQSRSLQSHTIILEGNCIATAATATIANAANTLRQQSRPLSSKRASPFLPEGKQSKTGFQKSNQNGVSIIRL